MQRCTHSAAGGTIHRLYPGFATVCSRSRNDKIPIVGFSPAAALLSKTAATILFLSPLLSSCCPCCSAQSPYTRQDRHACLKVNPSDGALCPIRIAGFVRGPLIRVSQTRLNLRTCAEKANWDRSRDRC